jgi:hypothetical protein
MNRQILKIAFTLTTLLMLTSCTSYKLGSSLPNDIKTVYVPICINKTKEINIENYVTQAILTRIQEDGSLKISDEQLADTILKVTIVEYELAPVRYLEGNEKTVSEYRLTLTAQFTFTRSSNGKVIMTSSAIGEHKFTPTGDMVQAKNQALPDAAANLSHYILEQVVDFWEF